MKRKKLLKSLAEMLDGQQRQQRQQRDELEALLTRLQKKLVALEEDLKVEKRDHKRKRLHKEVEIVRAQHAKGLEALQGREAS